MGIKISCLVLLTQLPDTELQHSNWKTLELVLGLLIITSTGIFMWLQGSNPGRVDENLSRMSHEEHQGLLIHSDSEDSTIPTSIDTEQATVNIHAIEAKEIVTRREIHYRQLKIEKIQLELAQYCSEDAQESEQHEHEEQLVMAEQSMPFCADCGFQPVTYQLNDMSSIYDNANKTSTLVFTIALTIPSLSSMWGLCRHI